VDWTGCRFQGELNECRSAKAGQDEQGAVDATVSAGGWRRIQVVGDLTAIVGKLVYFPFAVALIMVVSRLSYFDRWDFPVVLALVIGLNLAWAVGAGIALRRAAEHARERALEQINKTLESFKDPNLSQAQNQNAQLHLLKAEIMAYRRGAFASFMHQPVVQALLLVLSAVGISAVDYVGY